VRAGLWHVLAAGGSEEGGRGCEGEGSDTGRTGSRQEQAKQCSAGGGCQWGEEAECSGARRESHAWSAGRLEWGEEPREESYEAAGEQRGVVERFYFEDEYAAGRD